MPNVYFTKGKLYTNGYNWEVYRMTSPGNELRSLDISNSRVLFRPATNSSTAYSEWNYSGQNCSFSGIGSYVSSGDFGRTVVTIGIGHVYNSFSISSNGASNSISGAGRIRKLEFVNCDNQFGAAQGGNSFYIDTVIFSQDHTYKFMLNSNLVITSLFSAIRTSCSSSFVFEEFFNRDIVNITIESNAQVIIDGATITNINFIADRDIIASNSIDGGGSQGVEFQAPIAQTYYWVGGAGDWHDTRHWSLNNDGVYPASSVACVPTRLDNVIFNENSTRSLSRFTVNVRQAVYVNDIIVRDLDVPIYLASYNTDLFVAGSLDLSSDIIFNTKELHFISDLSGQTIRTGGNDLKRIRIQGNGSYTFLDNVTLSESISIYRGTLNTNGVRVEAYRIQGSGNSGVGRINLGSSEVYVHE